MQVLEYIPREENDDCAIIVTEFIAGMNLYQLISTEANQTLQGNKGSLTEKEAVTITRKIVQAVHDMHKRDVIHRDLHLRNLMLKFKSIQITNEDLDNPKHFFMQRLPKLLEEAVKHLEDSSAYSIQIIDYGLSREYDQNGQQV